MSCIALHFCYLFSRYIRDCNGVANKAPSTFIQSDDDSEESEKIDDDCNGDLIFLIYLKQIFSQIDFAQGILLN